MPGVDARRAIVGGEDCTALVLSIVVEHETDDAYASTGVEHTADDTARGDAKIAAARLPAGLLSSD